MKLIVVTSSMNQRYDSDRSLKPPSMAWAEVLGLRLHLVMVASYAHISSNISPAKTGPTRSLALALHMSLCVSRLLYVQSLYFTLYV